MKTQLFLCYTCAGAVVQHARSSVIQSLGAPEGDSHLFILVQAWGRIRTQTHVFTVWVPAHMAHVGSLPSPALAFKDSL